jgi:dihydrofolate reductase
MADLMNGIPKLVVSATLDRADWQNTSIARDGLEAALDGLDGLEGRDVVVTGSVALVKSLLRIGRLDELRLIVDPIVTGSGTQLFDDGTDIGLSLIESTPQESGAVSLHYAVGAR